MCPVYSVTHVPGCTGILPGHVAIMAALDTGPMRVLTEEGSIMYPVSGGDPPRAASARPTADPIGTLCGWINFRWPNGSLSSGRDQELNGTRLFSCIETTSPNLTTCHSSGKGPSSVILKPSGRASGQVMRPLSTLRNNPSRSA